jgi:hypothetical protein
MSLFGSQPTEPQRPYRGDVWLGLGQGLGINCLVFVFGMIVATSAFLFQTWILRIVMAIGVTQFVYLGPLMLRAHRNHRPGKMAGLIIAASITLLLNAACASYAHFWTY